MTNGPDTDKDMRSTKGAELAATIPFYEETSLPAHQMEKLKVRANGLSDLPELADSLIIVLDSRAGVYTFFRAAKDNAPEIGEVKEMRELELCALKIRENGFSDRPDLQDSRFEVVKNEDGSYIVSRESMLNHSADCASAPIGVAKTGAELALSIPFNEQVFLSHEDMSVLKIDSGGFSELPELNDSIFIGISPGERGSFLHRIALDNVPAIGETRLMTALEVSAMRILPTGESERFDLQDSHFTWKAKPDLTFTLTRHRK